MRVRRPRPLVALTLSGLAVGACMTTRPVTDWEAPAAASPETLPASPPAESAPVLDTDGGPVAADPDAGSLASLPDHLAVEEELRGWVKPPSLCFQDPAACGLRAPALSLAALRPDEDMLDELQSTWATWQSTWPLASRLLHCETLCAWRPAQGGVTCVTDLASLGGVEDGARRSRLLPLVDLLGRHGRDLLLSWVVHPNVEVRRDVAAWLETRAVDEALVEPLLQALDREPDQATAVSLIRTFSTLLSPKAVPLLGTIARGSAQPAARVAALETLVDLVGLRLRTWLPTVNQDDKSVRLAVAAARARLDAMEEGKDPAFDFGGVLEMLAPPPGPKVGAAQFLGELAWRRGGPIVTLEGVRLSPEEVDRLLRLLSDAGGMGLRYVRSFLAVSCTGAELERLSDVRRAILVAGLPDATALAGELTRVIRVVRTHYVLRQPTRWWRAPVVPEGEPHAWMP